jgi:hypothetical protein
LPERRIFTDQDRRLILNALQDIERAHGRLDTNAGRVVLIRITAWRAAGFHLRDAFPPKIRRRLRLKRGRLPRLAPPPAQTIKAWFEKWAGDPDSLPDGVPRPTPAVIAYRLAAYRWGLTDDQVRGAEARKVCI